MQRREFLGVLGSAAAWPLAARGQQSLPVIGILGIAFPEDAAVALNLKSFRKGLADVGYVDGQNVAFVYRWARYNEALLPALAAELVALKVNVIVTEGSTFSALAAKRATSTIPIVFHAGDALRDGLVSSLGRPEANLTGVSLFAPERLAKSFQLLSDLAPAAKVIAMLTIPGSPAPIPREIGEAAGARGVRLQNLSASSDNELEAMFASLGQQKAAAVITTSAPFVGKVVPLAARYNVPAVYSQSLFVTAGGLLSYGPSIPAAYVIKGNYAGKILNGAEPNDLPVVQPTKFDLAINLNAAKSLGLIVPATLYAQADDVIE
jgi:putative ABC transport system substrate-binding protein